MDGARPDGSSGLFRAWRQGFPLFPEKSISFTLSNHGVGADGFAPRRTSAPALVGLPRTPALDGDVEKGSVAPRRQFVARLLLLVSRTEPSRFPYLKHVFCSEAVDVVMGRPAQEGRQGPERAAAEGRPPRKPRP